MHRRRILYSSGATLLALLAGCTSSDDETDTGNGELDGDTDDNSEPSSDDPDGDNDEETEPDELEKIEPQTFDGSGDQIHDSEFDGGLSVVEATHDGESTFSVGFYRGMNDAGVQLVETSGVYEGETAAIVWGGWMDVRADGDWTVEIRQPRATAGEPLPRTLEGERNRVFGPLEFEGAHAVAAEHRGDSAFRVRLFSTDELVSELVDETGPYEDEVDVDYDGIGWIAVEADDEWTLELD